jgi:NADPH-dependent 2,4-dienoyl-CoA reductase/sulfur reductase-like enzyme
MSGGLLIVGGGAAGVAAAFKARELYPTLPITLITGEHPTPYARPSLMYLMMGQLRLTDLALAPEERWQEANITRVWGWVRSLESQCAHVETSEGLREFPFERLILATGAQPRPLPCEGAILKGVAYFGGLADLATLSELTPTTKRALVVGGGLIGAEVAEALLTRGVSVRLIVRETRYAPHLLNAHESALVGEELRAMGTELSLGVSLDQIEGEGRVSSATLITQEGERENVSCELVVGAIGAEPNLYLASQLTLRVVKPEEARAQGRPTGIWVDKRFQTSLEGVFAVGDCASALAHTASKSPTGHTGNSEAWPRGWVSAQQQGERAAYEAVSGLLTPSLPPLDSPSIPLLLPQAARYGRLTHKSLGDVHAPTQHTWRAPRTLWRRTRLLTLYEREGCLVGVSALEAPLDVSVWRPLLLEGVSLEEAVREAQKCGALKSLKQNS